MGPQRFLDGLTMMHALALFRTDWRLHSPQTLEKLAAYKQVRRRSGPKLQRGPAALIRLPWFTRFARPGQSLPWFNDRPARECYYSLHNRARTGTFLDKKIGEWFGPSTTAYVLR